MQLTNSIEALGKRVVVLTFGQWALEYQVKIEAAQRGVPLPAWFESRLNALDLHYASKHARPVGSIKQFLEAYELKEKVCELKSKQECQSLVRILNRMVRNFA